MFGAQVWTADLLSVYLFIEEEEQEGKKKKKNKLIIYCDYDYYA